MKNIIIFGKVTQGAHFGKKLGFPTANLDRRDYSRRHLKIKLGVYAGKAEIIPPTLPPPRGEKRKERAHRAGIVIGPIDKSGLPKIEAHLLNFKGNLYGKKVIISLQKYIRPFKKFSSTDVLKRQIKKDIQEIKKLRN